MEKKILTKKNLTKSLKKRMISRIIWFIIFTIPVVSCLMVFFMNGSQIDDVSAFFLLFFGGIFALIDLVAFLKLIHVFREYLNFDYAIITDQLKIEYKDEVLYDSFRYSKITKLEPEFSFQGLSQLKDSTFPSLKERREEPTEGDEYYIIYTTQVNDSVSVGPFCYLKERFELDDELKGKIVPISKLKDTKAYQKTFQSNHLFMGFIPIEEDDEEDDSIPIEGIPLTEENVFEVNTSSNYITLILFTIVFLIFAISALLANSLPFFLCILITIVIFILKFFKNYSSNNTLEYVIVEDTLLDIPDENREGYKIWTYQKFYEKFHVLTFFDRNAVSKDLVPGEEYYLIFYSNKKPPYLFKKINYDLTASLLEHVGTYDDVLENDFIPKHFLQDNPLQKNLFDIKK